jgi:hypothetical protein
MTLSKHELAKIMTVINTARYPAIYQAAEDYVRRKLPKQYERSVIDADKRLQTRFLQRRIASLFVRACQDYLSRDNGSRARQYLRDAEDLEAAVRVAKRDKDFFTALMGVHIEISVDAPAGTPGPIRMQSRPGDQALLALTEMAKSYREYANTLERDHKKITFFYCVGRLFAAPYPIGPRSVPALEPPTAGQANAVFKILVGAVRGEAAHGLAGVKTNYDPNAAANQILRLMKAGAHSLSTGRLSP